MKNTKINYLYRDAWNYKQLNTVIINGEITKEQIETIISYLNEGEYFIPSQVGLPEKRFDKISVSDHCWFELEADDFIITEESVTIDMTVEKLVMAFKQVNHKWNDTGFPLVI